jgi:hypothetical protein
MYQFSALAGGETVSLNPNVDFTASDARFRASGRGAAHDSSDRLTYEASTGTLTTIPTTTAVDIAVI